MARYALVVARFYEELAARLEARRARRCFEAQHGDEVEVVRRPGRLRARGGGAVRRAERALRAASSASAR